MVLTSRYARNTGSSLLLAVFLLGGAASEPAEARSPESFAAARSLVGSYLAGRFAKGQNEIASAADFYSTALLHDPDNEILIEQAFIMEASAANWERAEALAAQLVERQPQHRLAQLTLGVAAFKAGKVAEADKHLVAAGSGPIGDLTSALLRAWIKKSENKVSDALDLLDQPKLAEWAQFYLRYHRGLIADTAGRERDARFAYKRVFKQDSRTLRTALAYARHAANAGDRNLAKSVMREYIRRAGGTPHPLAVELLGEIESGRKIALQIRHPVQGISEALYGLGEALTTEGGVSIGIVYLQLALMLQPDQPLALAALAQAYETTKDYEAANATYDKIPSDTPLQNAVDIRRAFNLNALDKVDAAKTLLETVAKRAPQELAPLDALGNIMRSRKRYDEAIEFYSKAIKLIGKPEKRHWAFFYSRGTCYERTRQWPKAEADLKKALSLAPDQPLVLNYLGYSWIDQGVNLRKGLELIEKAVSLKPDDGYIVDSLGWAQYRLGRYQEAVRHLERAVELRPDDPVLNDHLGDALWRVGREREARFQWDQALSLGPEAEDAEKIRKKLVAGLPSRVEARALKKARAANRDDRRSKRVESVPPPTPKTLR
ncbi:MAG: tetratricopeptide repeat protein [Hyphomicrobiaceae bacterium]|nr:tetratricopeptide repeat protein [Hyphomicrobiaceae bacterium]